MGVDNPFPPFLIFQFVFPLCGAFAGPLSSVLTALMSLRLSLHLCGSAFPSLMVIDVTRRLWGSDGWRVLSVWEEERNSL